MKFVLYMIAVVFAAPITSAHAQSYPSKIVRVVIPWPGGSNDAAGRSVFQKIAESVGQPVVIDNRPGASGTIGATLVARSAPDGYTVMVTSASIVSNMHLYKKLPYDTMKDFHRYHAAGGAGWRAGSASVSAGENGERADRIRQKKIRIRYCMAHQAAAASCI
jgi:tripartite-type tricarboxylate transporter receptor subunit TctC